MMPRQIAAGLTVVLGLTLVALAVLLPGGERLIRENLPLDTHVTVLAPGDGGTILAASQDGVIWRFDGEGWTQEDPGLAGRLVLALRGEPERDPIGTATGLFVPPDVKPDVTPLPVQTRVSDVLNTASGLLAASADGLWVSSADRWQHLLPGLSLYRLVEQRRDDRVVFHAGTIGAGVYSAPQDAVLLPWRANSRGLPEGVKVLSFAVTDGGILLAGTDQGLYWQTALTEPWTAVAAIPPFQRVLALYRAPPDSRGVQRLWIGGDVGLSALDLRERDGALAVDGPLQRVDALWEPPQTGVSWIVPVTDGLMISAGAVYRLQPVRYPGGYRFVLGAILLFLAGAWLWWWPQEPDDDGA